MKHNFEKIDKGRQQRSSHLLEIFINDPRIANLLNVETTTLKIILRLSTTIYRQISGLKNLEIKPTQL